MRIVRFEVGDFVKYGTVDSDDVVHGLQYNPFDGDQDSSRRFSLDGSTYALAEVSLLAPCTPSKYVGVGINYHKSAEAKNLPIPQVPIVFLKPSTSVIGPDAKIIIPASSEEVRHEGELALVMGKEAKDVPEDRARDYILGYTCSNDLTDFAVFREDGGNPTRAKAQDTFGPIGPWIETEIDAEDLEVEVYVNGALRQSGRTSDLIHGINKVVSFISRVMTLLPGDVIATGTPPGSGPIKPGDVVEVKVEKIGTLRNFVAGAK